MRRPRDSKPAPAGDAGPVKPPTDTLAQAIPGGVFKDYYSQSNPPSLDPHTSQGFTTLNTIAAYTYPRILKFKAARYPAFPSGEVEGDLAETFELSPDGLQVTLKVRPGMAWEAKAPTSGREIDAEDVVWNWKKFSQVGVRRGDLAYSSDNQSSPVESIVATDRRTVLVKLKAPDSSILQLLASARIFFVVPREAEGGFDSRNEVRGYGPWLLEEYVPSARLTWRKAPNYYLKGRPFFDKIEQPFVTEYAQRLAQFKAGNIYPTVATQEDILGTLRDNPALILRYDDGQETNPPQISFGYEGDSAFKDVRVRQAVALAIDRELMADTFSNRARFRDQGIDLSTSYGGLLGPGWGEYWLDPQNESKFGPNSKYWAKFDPAEAKKLMAAAGYPQGVITELHFAINQYAAPYEQIAAAIGGVMAEVGISAKSTPHDYQSDFIPNVYYSYQGDSSKGFSGMLYRREVSYPTAVAQLFGNYHKDGGRYRGVSPDGRNAKQGDPKLNQMIEQARREFDMQKQIALVNEILRYSAGQAYSVPPVPSTLPLVLHWPVIANYGLYRTAPGANASVETITPTWWLDMTRKPVGAGA